MAKSKDTDDSFLDNLADELGRGEKGDKSWYKLECLDMEDDDD